MANRLADQTSPYLLQHKDNPVDWYPWGEEALARARGGGQAAAGLDRLLGLPLVPRDGARVLRGPETAAVMNENFVPVKVDREERPDVDSIYMGAVQAMTGQGGWPLNVFIDPEACRSTAARTSRPSPVTGCRASGRSSEGVARRGGPAGTRSAPPRRARRGAERDARMRALRRSCRRAGSTRPSGASPRQFDPNFGGFGGRPSSRRPRRSSS